MTIAIPADSSLDIALIGAGPAGLAAAEVLSGAGRSVHLFDAMPSVGRKFLLAGKGGLNLTHAEPFEAFVTRYGERRSAIVPLLRDFGPDTLRTWAAGLGVDTFVGTSQRVFPTDMKAAPLLRAWLQRLRHPMAPGVPVTFHMRHRWTGWDADGALCFDTPAGPRQVRARAVLLALGGGSWARLGSDGAWVPLLAARGVPVVALAPSNCGFDAAGRDGQGWTSHFRERFAGQPFKSVAINLGNEDGGAALAPPGRVRGHGHRRGGQSGLFRVQPAARRHRRPWPCHVPAGPVYPITRLSAYWPRCSTRAARAA
jgi:predicted Rossmann fold flavoprotein